MNTSYKKLYLTIFSVFGIMNMGYIQANNNEINETAVEQSSMSLKNEQDLNRDDGSSLEVCEAEKKCSHISTPLILNFSAFSLGLISTIFGKDTNDNVKFVGIPKGSLDDQLKARKERMTSSVNLFPWGISTTSPLALSTTPLSIPGSSLLPFGSSILPSSKISGLSSLSSASSSINPSLSMSSVPSSVLNGSFSAGTSTASVVSTSSALGPLNSFAIPLSIAGAFAMTGGNAREDMIKTYYYPAYSFAKKEKDYEFRNVVTFGDSLSDSGTAGRSSVYVAGGNPFVFYHGYLSLFLSGKYSTPYNVDGENNGGTNYAISGAIVKEPTFSDILGDPTQLFRNSMNHQLEKYYTRNGGKADPNDIFVIWGGGNDLTADVSGRLINGNPEAIIKLFETDSYISDKPIVLGDYAQNLIDHGANNIFVMGLPDPGHAPYSGTVPLSVPAEMVGYLLMSIGLQDFNVFRIPLRNQDAFLRNPNNLIGDPKGRGEEYITENVIRSIQNTWLPLPADVIRPIYETVVWLQREFVKRWNNDLNNRVAAIDGGNPIYFDIYGLTVDVINDPVSYGIDNVLVPECELGTMSTICDPGDPHYHGDDGQTYLYTDWHHISPEFHQIIAEYMLNIFNAPGYVATLNKNIEINDDVRTHFIKSELKSLRYNDSEIGNWNVFANVLGGISKDKRSLSGKAVHSYGLGLGASYRVAQYIDLGAAFVFGFGDKKSANQLSYRNNNQSVTLFAQYAKPDGLWANGSLSYSREQMDNITRSMTLGKAFRKEVGETKGDSKGISASIGYDFPLNVNCAECSQSWNISPYLEASINKYHVDAYTERDNTIMSMTFKEQNRTVKLGTIGVQIVSRSPKVNTNLDLAYTHSFDNEDIKATGAVKSNTQNYFTRSSEGIAKKRKGGFSITPSVEYKIKDNISVYGSVNYNTGRGRLTDLNGSLGVKASF